MVVMEHNQLGGFGCGGNEEVGDLRTSLLASIGEGVLHCRRSVEHVLTHRDERPIGTSSPHRSMCGRAGRRETGLKVCRRAPCHQTGLEKRVEARSDPWPRSSRQCRDIAQIEGPQPHAARRSSGSAISSDTAWRCASRARRRRSRASTSSKAVSTVALRVRVPRRVLTSSSLSSSTSISRFVTEVRISRFSAVDSLLVVSRHLDSPGQSSASPRWRSDRADQPTRDGGSS